MLGKNKNASHINGDRLFLLGSVPIAFILLGVIFRFWHITKAQFIYYDEGLYLAHNIDFLYYINDHPAQSLAQLFKYLEISFHMALSDAKALWFFLASLRGYLFGPEAWGFTRLLSAIFGSLTIGVMFLFVKRYYNSRILGVFAAALLAIMPSHLYYSRTGMQEALSTFCFFLGIYLYVFAKGLNWRTILAGIVLSGVFFTNYRMIVIPILLMAIEFLNSRGSNEKIDFRKYIWATLTFLLMVFCAGSLYQGANTKITFAWMFYQAQLAQGQFEFFNLLSYPYYIFRLEGLLFGLFFFGNVYFIFKKEYKRAFAFGVVLIQMILFSFSQEKGVRYLCVVMPFMVVAVISLIDYLWEKNNQPSLHWLLGGLVVLLTGSLLMANIQIVGFKTSYQSSIADLKIHNASPKVLSTQPLIHKMYVSRRTDVMPAPDHVMKLIAYYQKGYRYLIVDPQAYISYTEDAERFSLNLKDYLNFVLHNLPPQKVYDHFSEALLERFVLEHNVNLKKSIAFLKNNKNNRFGQLYVYDISQLLKAIKLLQNQSASVLNPNVSK